MGRPAVGHRRDTLAYPLSLFDECSSTAYQMFECVIGHETPIDFVNLTHDFAEAPRHSQHETLGKSARHREDSRRSECDDMACGEGEDEVELSNQAYVRIRILLMCHELNNSSSSYKWWLCYTYNCDKTWYAILISRKSWWRLHQMLARNWSGFWYRLTLLYFIKVYITTLG